MTTDPSTDRAGSGHEPEIERSLASQVYARLRTGILEGDIPAGERLRERDLAASLEVSRVPIREAILRLQADGLVATSERRGAIVTTFTVRDFVELFEVRLSLEPLAARLAAEQAQSGASVARLADALGQALTATATGEAAAIADANSAFHSEMLDLSGNRLLQTLMVPVVGRVRRLFYLEAERDQNVLCQEHSALFEAIESGNGALAGALGFAHVEHSRAESLKLVASILPRA